MAPSRKSRSLNKRFSYINDSPNKEGENASKSRQRKRKLPEMLGPQWSKEELARFYEAYRKYGKDWKKVAAVVRNRSVEMVDALYTMNRAYLSLPEGTASVVGLIAMMTDHYSVLGGSDSEQESNEGTGTSQKPLKGARAKSRDHPSKGLEGLLSDRLQFQSATGCLSLLKKRRTGSAPRAVGKRTPRVPVSYSLDKDNRERYFSPVRQGLKLKVDAIDDDVAHEIALALTEASQRGGSPQVSQTPNRNVKTPPVQKGKRTHTASGMTSGKLRGSEMDEDGGELSLGSTEADNGDFDGEKSYLISTDGSGVMEVQQKGKRYYGKKRELEDSANNHLDDIKEACSGTEEGQKLESVKGKFEAEFADGKIAKTSNKGLRKRSKKVLFGGDEGSAFDALQTLADLSLMMPETTADTESSIQIKEEKTGNSDDCKAKGNNSTAGVKFVSQKASKLGKLSAHDVITVPETEGISQNSSVTRKRRQKSSPFKIPKDEAPASSHFSESPNIEGTSEVKKLFNKGKRTHNVSLPKQGRLVKSPEHTSSSSDRAIEGDNSTPSTMQIICTNQVNLPTKVRSRRKIETQKLLMKEDMKSSEDTLSGQSDAPIPPLYDKLLNLKEKLSNLLSRPKARSWCVFEWFYSAIDYPWFAKREFVEYLDHVGLGHVPRLTRVEWGVIRSSLGKPRRFSEQFLKEEKEKLNQYRESVRKHYAELHAGSREGLPTDLARPLKVGQSVIALHPRAREIHDGCVLTVDHSRCRVQFDQPELGVEFVKDIDCMPSNRLENLPASLTRQSVNFDRFIENFNELKMNGQPKERMLEGYLRFGPFENLENTNSPPHISPSAYHLGSSLQQQKNGLPQVKVGVSEAVNVQQAVHSQPCNFTQFQAREADVQAVSELTRALDKKEAVVSELKRMNDEVLENQKDGHNSLKDSDSFKKQYAAVLFQLREINEQVSSALFQLRQRNTYQGNPYMWLKPMPSLGDPGGHSSSFDHPTSKSQECGSHVAEIVESSRTKAQTMVDAAMQAMASLRKGQNSVERIEEAIDFVNNQLSVDNALADSSPRNSAPQDQPSTYTSNLLATSQAPDPQLNSPDQNEPQIPSELIARCVATLLMIQKCTERQFPPGDVASVLDSAVTSLQPCCSQNLPIYAEIQKCMGIIRNQILALIPT